MNISNYDIRETWDEAVSNTDDGLMPMAVKMVNVPDLPPIDKELALGDNHYPYVVVCMTTVFKNEAMNGKLGWCPLVGELRQNISQMLYDNGLLDKWVFLSQHRA